MDTGSIVNSEMSENASVEMPGTKDDCESQGQDATSEQENSDSDWVPEGPTYPLNSKRVKVEQLQLIAKSLGLPTTGTSAVTRQLIEGKLLEMEKGPKNAQVVL